MRERRRREEDRTYSNLIKQIIEYKVTVFELNL